MNFFKTHFSGYKFLRMLHKDVNYKLSLFDRAVYSLLVQYPNRHLSKYKLSKLLVINRTTISKSIARLTASGLVRASGYSQYAQKPSVGFKLKAKDKWYKDGVLKHWSKHYGYGLYLYPSDTCPLTWLQVATYCQLMVMDQQGYRVTVKGISKTLSVSPISVRTALKLLIKLKLIDSRYKLLEPSELHKTWFVADRKKVNEREKAIVVKLNKKIDNDKANETMNPSDFKIMKEHGLAIAQYVELKKTGTLDDYISRKDKHHEQQRITIEPEGRAIEKDEFLASLDR